MRNDKTALLIIDLINHFDFDGGEELLTNTRPIVDPVLALKQRFKEKGQPVIYVNDNFGLWHESAEDVISTCLKGKGKDIVERVRPEEDDFFIVKPKHSGFFGTQLEILLKQLETERLVLTGVASDMCILFTANDAYMREYELIIPKDCIAAETKEANEHAVGIMEDALSIPFTPSGEIEIRASRSNEAESTTHH